MSETVLITGASRGIGFACAELFAENGYVVFANYRQTAHTLPPLAGALAERGRTLRPVQADVSDGAGVAQLFAQTGGVDILINNAGIAQSKPFQTLAEADWDRMMNVHLKSAFLCTRAALPHMLMAQRGVIVNMASVWGLFGGACEAHYSAAKAGLIGLTYALARELGPSGIRVNAIAPGVIETGMLDPLSDADRAALRERTPLGQIGTPAQVAQAALYLAQSAFVTGTVLRLDGGFTG